MALQPFNPYSIVARSILAGFGLEVAHEIWRLMTHENSSSARASDVVKKHFHLVITPITSKSVCLYENPILDTTHFSHIGFCCVDLTSAMRAKLDSGILSTAEPIAFETSARKAGLQAMKNLRCAYPAVKPGDTVGEAIPEVKGNPILLIIGSDAPVTHEHLSLTA